MAAHGLCRQAAAVLCLQDTAVLHWHAHQCQSAELISLFASALLQLLEAYLLQGVPPEALAEKVLSSFSDLFKDVSARLVRSMVLAKAFAQQSESGDSPRSSSAGSLHLDECSFAELCRKVTPDILQPCVTKLLEALYDLLASYHNMVAWHEAGLAEHTQAAAAAAAAAAHAASRSSEHSEGGSRGLLEDQGPADGQVADAVPSQEQLDQVQAATKGILVGVLAALQARRSATAEAAAALVKELLAGAGGCTGSDFPQARGTSAHVLCLILEFAQFNHKPAQSLGVDSQRSNMSAWGDCKASILP
jgi:hypothetical protein